MSIIVPEEELGISLQKLRQMVATSETFQRGVQGGYGDALGRVYFGRQSGSPTRPFVCLLPETFRSRLIAGGSQNFLRPEGEIRALIEVDADTSLGETDQESVAMDFMRGVLREVDNLSAVDDTTGEYNESHLPITAAVLDRVGKNESRFRNSLGQFYVGTCTISWGDG